MMICVCKCVDHLKDILMLTWIYKCLGLLLHWFASYQHDAQKEIFEIISRVIFGQFGQPKEQQVFMRELLNIFKL